MGSAFKNFIITFSICLLVFGFLGFTYVPDLLDNMKMGSKEESSDVSDEMPADDSSEDENSDASDSTPDSSTPVIPDPGTTNSNIVNPDGKVFTAVIMTVDAENYPLDVVFIDANAKTERFIYCQIPTTTKVKNNRGEPMTIRELFCALSNEEIAECVSAMTGIETKYCLKFTRDSLKKIVNTNLNYSIKLEGEGTAKGIPVVTENGDIHYINNGSVKLRGDFYGKDNIEWLLDYAPENVNLNDYNVLYSKIAKAMLRQFLSIEASGSTPDALATIIRNCDTNLTSSTANEFIETIFSYGEFRLIEFIEESNNEFPPSREGAVKALREADGSYN